MKHLISFMVIIAMMTSCISTKEYRNKMKMAKATQRQGEALLAQGNYTGALSKLLEAQKALKKDPELYNSLGLAYMGKDRDSLAIAAFETALELKPDYTEALNNKGVILLRTKEWDKAIETFNIVLEDILYPTPHYPLSNLGWAYLRKMDIPTAESYFLKALDSMPWFVTASHGLTQLYLMTSRPEKAMRYLKNCLKRKPNAAILYADMARALEMKGEIQKARTFWMRALDLSPPYSSLAKEAEAELSKTDS